MMLCGYKVLRTLRTMRLTLKTFNRKTYKRSALKTLQPKPHNL